MPIRGQDTKGCQCRKQSRIKGIRARSFQSDSFYSTSNWEQGIKPFNADLLVIYAKKQLDLELLGLENQQKPQP